MNEPGRFAEGWTEPPIRNFERLWNIIDVLIEIANEKRVTVAQVALAWLLAHPSVTSLVVGARNMEQLESNIAAVNLKLTESEMDRLNKVSELPLIYPYWHQGNFAKRRFSEADNALFAPYLRQQ